MGRPWVWQGSHNLSTQATCAESSEASPCAPTVAAPSLPQWPVVETALTAATTTPCLLARAGVSATGCQEDPTHFTVNGFSAGSSTGAVIALAIRCLWPASQTTVRLGAIAMPKSVFAALRRSLVCNNPCISRV